MSSRLSLPSTSRQTPWKEAWDKAQPTLASLESTLRSDSESPPRGRVLRVGQLDSELLDQELVQLLLEPVKKAFGLINSALKNQFEPELTSIIQLSLYRLSIWNTGASYGAKLQGLKYTSLTSNLSGLSLAPSGIPRRKLFIHGTLTILLPYIHTRIRAHALSKAWPDAPSTDRRRKAWELLTSLEASHSFLTLLNFIAFLWHGRYRTLADRMLQMQLVPVQRSVKREVSYEFMNRQMVWHAFTEFLIFLLPLINARSLRRRVARIMLRLNPTAFLPDSVKAAIGIATLGHATNQTSRTMQRGKYHGLQLDQCAICAENASLNLNISESANVLTTFTSPAYMNNIVSSIEPADQNADTSEPPPFPLHTPYITSCGHVYCYHCIAERMMRAADDGVEEDGWECLRCRERVRSADRVEGVADPEFSDAGDDYGFSTDADVTDFSASVGSYSDSDSVGSG